MEKNLKISSELHKEIKIICATEGIKINEWVEKVLKEKIDLKNKKIA
jgi:predicted HicB family RNase H-like nuclease